MNPLIVTLGALVVTTIAVITTHLTFVFFFGQPDARWMYITDVSLVVGLTSLVSPHNDSKLGDRMKAWLVYWVAGCIFIGITLGNYQRRCPQDNFPARDEIIQMVLIYPVIIGVVTFGNVKKSCDKD